MKPSSSTSSKNNVTTVVILDEIDYLITEKQSVLYNFFDWPKRAQASSVGKRLVVVGVSIFCDVDRLLATFFGS